MAIIETSELTKEEPLDVGGGSTFITVKVPFDVGVSFEGVHSSMDEG